MTSLPPPPTHKGQVQLGRLRFATNQDGFDTPLCAPAVGFSCLGGAGCDVCCAAVFCPCYLFGANVKMLRSGSHHSACADAFACRRSEACFKFLIPYSCIGMGMVASGIAAPIAFCPLAMYTASYRHLIRKEFGITSSGQCVPGFSNDIFTHYFCMPFALCQENMELNRSLPFTPLKKLYTPTGESVGITVHKKKEKFRWSFNLDDVSDDEDDEHSKEFQKRRIERQQSVALNAPAQQGMSKSSSAKFKNPHDLESGPWRLYKQDDSIRVDGRCNLCGSGPFHNLDQFSDHMVQHTNLRKIHEAIRNKTGTVTCNKCAKPFNNVPALGGHRCR